MAERERYTDATCSTCNISIRESPHGASLDQSPASPLPRPSPILDPLAASVCAQRRSKPTYGAPPVLSKAMHMPCPTVAARPGVPDAH